MLNNHFNRFCFGRVKQLIRRDNNMLAISHPWKKIIGLLLFVAIVLGVVISTQNDNLTQRDGLRIIYKTILFYHLTVPSSALLFVHFLRPTNNFLRDTLGHKNSILQFARGMLPVTPLEFFVVYFFYIAIGIPSITYIAFLSPFNLTLIMLNDLAWHNFFMLDPFFWLLYSATSALVVLLIILSFSVYYWPYRRIAPWPLRWLTNLFLYSFWLVVLYAIIVIGYPVFAATTLDDCIDHSFSVGLMIAAIIFWGISGLIQTKYA